MKAILHWPLNALAGLVIVLSGSAFSPAAALAAGYNPQPPVTQRSAVGYGSPMGAGPQACVSATYRVHPRDTLSGIARRFDVSPRMLASSNGLHRRSNLFPGMRLNIPCAPQQARGHQPAPSRAYRSNPSHSPGYGSNPSYSSGNRSNPSYSPGYGSNPSYSSGYGSNPSYSPAYPPVQASPTPAPMPSPAAGQVTVVMQNIAFNPANITIHVGQQVVWVNNDSVPHTTTSGSCTGVTCTPSPGWDSGTLNPGQSFSHTFTTAGTFTYFCLIHGAVMQGTVTVMP